MSCRRPAGNSSQFGQKCEISDFPVTPFCSPKLFRASVYIASSVDRVFIYGSSDAIIVQVGAGILWMWRNMLHHPVDKVLNRQLLGHLVEVSGAISLPLTHLTIPHRWSGGKLSCCYPKASWRSEAQRKSKLECGPMPNLMVALPNTGGALCSMPQFGWCPLLDAVQ